jgi:hypothetical protein
MQIYKRLNALFQVMVIVQGRSAEPGGNLRTMSNQRQSSFNEYVQIQSDVYNIAVS